MKKAQGEIKYYAWKGVKIFIFGLIFVFLSGIIWDLYYSFFSDVDVSPQYIERNYLKAWTSRADRQLSTSIDNDSILIEELSLYLGDSIVIFRDTIGIDTTSTALDSIFQLVDTLDTAVPTITFKDNLRIQGITRPGMKVELHVNKRRKKKVFTDNTGWFNTYLSDLPRGQSELLFLIEQSGNSSLRSIKNDEHIFPLIVQVLPPQIPEVLVHRYNDDKNVLECFGIGEPGYTYAMAIGGYSTTIKCDGWGFFFNQIPGDILLSDTTAYFSSISLQDTLTKINIRVNDKRPLVDAPNLLSRKSAFIVDDSLKYIEAALSVKMPISSALYQMLASREIQTQKFVSLIWGAIAPEQFINTEIIVKDSLAIVSVAAKWDYTNAFDIPQILFNSTTTNISQFPLFSSHDSLIINIPSNVDFIFNETPDATLGVQNIWTGPKTESTFITANFISEQSDKEVVAMQEIKSEEEKPKDVFDAFLEMQNLLFNRNSNWGSWLSSITWAIFLAIPLIWSLWLIKLHEHRYTEIHQQLFRILSFLVFFHFYYYVLFINNNLLDAILGKNLRFLWYHSFHYSKFLMIGILLFYLLAYEITSPPSLSSKNVLAKRLISIFALVVLSFFTGYMLIEYLEAKDLQPYFVNLIQQGQYFTSIIISSIVVFILFYLLALLIRLIIKESLKITLEQYKVYNILITVTLIAVGLGVSTRFLSEQWSRWPSFLWALTTSIFGALMLFWGSRLTFHYWPDDYARRRKWRSLVFFIFFAFIAFPKDELTTAVEYSYLTQCYKQILDLFPFAVPFIIVILLYHYNKKRSFDIDKLTVEWGILLIAVFIVERGYVYSSGYRWMYIPISMILAYYLSHKFLFLNPEKANKAFESNPLTPGKSSDELSNVFAYLNFKDQYDNLRKLTRKKFSKNEIDYNSWTDNVSKNETILQQLRAKATQDEVPLEELIFSKGIKNSPWENAVATVKTGTWLAVLWIFVLIRDFRGWEVNELDYYPVFGRADNLMDGIFIWFIIAFVFGYFFHVLKGRNGIEKAFYLSFIILLARIGPGILFADSIDQISNLLIWGLQVLIFCMFLGFFAFDFKVLRSNGYGFRQAGLLYNLTFLSTFGTTLFAAFAGILSGQLQEWFKTLLTMIFSGGS